MTWSVYDRRARHDFRIDTAVAKPHLLVDELDSLPGPDIPNRLRMGYDFPQGRLEFLLCPVKPTVAGKDCAGEDDRSFSPRRTLGFCEAFVTAYEFTKTGRRENLYDNAFYEIDRRIQEEIGGQPWRKMSFSIEEIREFRRTPGLFTEKLQEQAKRSDLLSSMRLDLLKKYPGQWVALTQSGTLIAAASVEEMVAKIEELGEHPPMAAADFMRTGPRRLELLPR